MYERESKDAQDLKAKLGLDLMEGIHKFIPE